jgi:hypothetical protein
LQRNKAMNGGSVQSQWRALTKLFPVWMMPLDFFFNASTYRFWGADLISSMQADWRVRRAAAVLSQQPQMLETLAQLADINVARTNDAFKAVALAYVTLPLALAALVSDAAPEAARAALTEHLPWLWPLIAALALTPLLYFCGHWRAKQIAWSIALFRAGAVAAEQPKRR